MTNNSNKRIKVAVDDGSTNVKISYIKDGELLTYICAHSFAKEHKPSSNDEPAFNITIDGNKYHFTGGSKALSTTNISFQESDMNLAAIHYALLHSGVGTPDELGEIDLVVTLPVTQYYNYQSGSGVTKNTKNIESKKQKILREVVINDGIETVADTNIYGEVKPFKIANVEVMAEGIPAIMTSLFEAEVEQYANTILIDLGGTTLDMCLIEGEFRNIEPFGYEDINVDRVISAVREAWGGSQSQARISHLIANRDDEIVWEKTFKNPKKREVVKAALNAAAEKVSEQVVAAAKKLHEAPDYVYLVGGGASLVVDAVTKAFELDSVVEMIPSPQTALAREIAIYHSEDEEIAVPTEA